MVEQVVEGTDDSGISEILVSAEKKVNTANLVEFNPLEKIPTLAVGQTWVAGTTLTGRFVRNETLASPKFTNSKTVNEQGVPTQIRHIFKSVDGKLFGIWTTGELNMVCEKLAENELIEMTYVEKGKNAKGQNQHFFKFKKEAAAGH